MTMLSPKPNSNHSSNGRGSYSKNYQVEGRTSATNYSSSTPRQTKPYQDSKAMQLPPIEEILPYSQTQKFPAKRPNLSRWLSKSLRVKVTAAAIAMGTIPVVLIGTVGYFAAHQQFQTEIYQNEQSTAGDLKDKIFLFMKERVGDLDVMSHNDMFVNSKIKDKFSRQEKEELLNRFARIYGYYDSIALFDLQGNVLAQSQSEVLPNHFDRDYFQEVLKTDRLFITEPRLSETTRTVHFYLASPVKDPTTNKTIAILRSRLPIKVFQEIFNVQSERQQGYYFLDASGKIAVSNDNDAIGKKLEEEFPKLLSQIKKTDSIEYQTVVTPHEQRQDLVTYTPTLRYKAAYNLNWALVTTRPTEVAFAAETQLLWTLFLGTAAATVVVGAIAAYVANRSTRPILAATNAVDKIGHGELNTRVEVQGDDELATLASNINEMAGQLQVFVQEQELATEQARLVAKVTGSRAVNSQELEELFKDIIDETRQILNVDRVVIYRFKPDLSGYISSESVAAGLPRAFSNQTENFHLSELQDGKYREDFVVALDNIFEAHLDSEHLHLLERWQVKSKLEAPIFHEGQPHGMLIAHHCHDFHEWQETEVNFLTQLATQMALALDRVILLERTEELLGQTKLLASEQQQLKEGLQKRALDLLKEVDPISKGDLTIRARVTADEIGTIADSYNATVSNLRKIVEKVQAAATQVTETTITDEKAVQALSTEALRGAKEIAQALERAQEMAESVRRVAENAQLAATTVREATQTVEEGDLAMNRTVDGILAIRETVAETAKKVKHLGESSQKISTVVNLISTFAAQTNLLALNASIEAARAGEEGRGFAVVADEVRALARQSAEATSEIEKLVAAIQAETNEVVAAMEAGTEQVVVGTKLVDETRQSLNKVTAASSQINQLVEEIAQATIVQTQASETVTQTMTNVAEIAEKTSKEAIFVSSSFEQLLKVAQTLQEDVGQFKVS